MQQIDRRRLALVCRTCTVVPGGALSALDLPGVPVNDAVTGDPIAMARHIGKHRPDLLGAVVAFCDEHQGHDYAPCSIEPIEDWRARS